MGTSPLNPIPEETRRAAAEAHILNRTYRMIGDQLENFINQIPWGTMKESDDEPDGVLALLALVSLFQFTEKMSDSLAAIATGLRVDWKYALHLPVSYPGMDSHGLCIFRQRLITKTESIPAFELLIWWCAEYGLFLDLEDTPSSALVIEINCLKNCLDRTINTMLPTLEALAAEQPAWLRKVALPHWYTRYITLHQRLQQVNSREDLHGMLDNLYQDMRYLSDAIHDHPDLLLKGYPEVANFLQEWGNIDQLLSKPNLSGHVAFPIAACAAYCNHQPAQPLSAK